ncbi:hypothetical protein BDV29DRAFT_185459 [Aspergillus leporis]|uniref:Uncharacterized protein n=1 Tax=Aspergillus leporis TaxID=41062 RepID=A0A5N5WKQ0_9EURO|nr:hypothetical protein BDV29DRAFT_185459 [Aspergillus leporis]
MDVHAYTLHERPTPESRQKTSYVKPGINDPNDKILSHSTAGTIERVTCQVLICWLSPCR